MNRNNLINAVASKIPTRRSIGGNLHLITGVVFTLLAVAIVCGYSYLFSRLARAERMDNVSAFGGTLSSLIARPVSAGDYLSVEQSLQGSALQDFICSIQVVSLDGMPIGSVENTSSRHCADLRYKTALKFPIVTSAALDPAGTRKIGFVILNISLADLHASAYQNIAAALMLGAVLLIFLILFNRVAVDVALLPLKRAVESAQASSRKNLPNLALIEAAPLEIQPLLRTFKSLFTEYAKAEGDIRAGQVAGQAAHDIRSPLAALEMMAHSSKMPEGERVILRQAATRIRDIANDLSGRYRESSVQATGPRTSQLIPVLIDEIMSEMRMRYRTKPGLEIAANMDERNYGLFAVVDPASFKRALSNVIQNAVEAIHAEGKVEIRSEARAGHAMIEISDTGHGIPADLLPRLGERGTTFGRENGSGLGLHYAKQIIEEAGGFLEIKSEVGQGTKIQFVLPLSAAPEWFVPTLKLSRGTTVAVLDDDQSVHQIWSGRFSQHSGNGAISLRHFNTAKALRDWATTHTESARSAQYLLDFELIGEEDTGISIVEELSIQDRSILVTSRYDEPTVRDACSRNRIRLIPKGLATFVPIHVGASPALEPIAAVLIDDDEIAHTIWNHVAEQNSRRVLTVFSEAELEKHTVPTQTPIYVDRHLANTSGEVVLANLHRNGFSNLYLTTGDSVDAGAFPGLPFLRGVVGKGVPAELIQ